MRNGLKELDIGEKPTCTNCCVGFPLDENDKYCGFCGQKTQALEAKIFPLAPIYLDQQGPVNITLTIRNVGLTNCSINTENFDVKCQ